MNVLEPHSYSYNVKIPWNSPFSPNKYHIIFYVIYGIEPTSNITYYKRKWNKGRMWWWSLYTCVVCIWVQAIHTFKLKYIIHSTLMYDALAIVHMVCGLILDKIFWHLQLFCFMSNLKSLCVTSSNLDGTFRTF